MNTKEILIEVTSNYVQLADLVRRIIAAKVEDTATIDALRAEVAALTSRLDEVLAQESETSALASSLSANITNLVAEAAAALPATT